MMEGGSSVGQFESAKLRALNGCQVAQLEVALMLVRGDGVSQDSAEAAKWFRKAAEQGNVEAQGALGLMYSKGEGVHIDLEEAAYWYRAAAEQGDVDAQLNLARMYEEGRGVARDLREAAKWLTNAEEASRLKTLEEPPVSNASPSESSDDDNCNLLYEDEEYGPNTFLDCGTFEEAVRSFDDKADNDDSTLAAKMSWDELNEATVCSIIDRLSAFQSRSRDDELAKQIVERIALSSSTFADYIVSPKHEFSPIISQPPMQISPHQVLQLHRSVIWTFTALYWKRCEIQKDTLAIACAHAVGPPDSKLEEARLDFVETSDDSAIIAEHLFRHIRKVLNVDCSDCDLDAKFRFAALLGSVYSMTVDELAAIEVPAEKTQHVRTDPSLVRIASKIKSMSDGDKEFATAMLTSAWQIIDELATPVGVSVSQQNGFGMQTYKWLLCHHCMLLFYRDLSAKLSMRRMITDLTDGDYSCTEAFCTELELSCSQIGDGDVPVVMTIALWARLHSLIYSSKSEEPIAVQVILAHFEQAKSKVRHLFA